MLHRLVFAHPQRWLSSALCVAALAAPLIATAQKVKESSFGKGKASGPLLSRAQLRECLAQKESLRVQGEQTLALQAQFERDKAEIQRLGSVLKDELAVLDRSNPDAVDQYNTKAVARDKSIDDFEARAQAHNLRVQNLNVEREAFARACENRRFDETDEIAIKKEK